MCNFAPKNHKTLQNDKTIKHLIFDLGGVLVDLDRNACITAFEKLGFKNVETFLGDYGQKDIFRLFETGAITEPEFYDLVRAQLPNPVSDQLIANAFNAFLLSVNPLKTTLLNRLKKNRFVSMLSNVNPIHFNSVLQRAWNGNPYHIYDCFNHLFLSYELHLCKPDPEIYRKVVEISGFKPEETLFFDDSAANIEAAQDLGFNTCLISKDYSILDYFAYLN